MTFIIRPLFFTLLKIPKIVAVCGNIGAGKTTFINQYQSKHPEEHVIQLCESRDKWKVLFDEYYQVIASNKTEYTLEE